MNISLFKLALTFLLCGISTISVIARGTITGTVRSLENNETIRGATLRLEGTALGANTNKDGVFRIREVPNGTYTILTSIIGYSSKKILVTVKNNDTTNVEIFLKEQILMQSEVIVSANKRVQAVQDVPMSVSVVDQRDIQQRNVTRLDDILRYIPGVTVAGSQVSIRGASGFALGVGSRTSLLIDNLPMLSADNGDMSFDALPMYEVERIEVVKGAGSALYGTSALGGVINVLTRDPKEYPEFRIRSYSGLYTRPQPKQWIYQERLSQLSGFDASYSQRIGAVGWILSGGIKSDDSYRLFGDSFRWNIFNKWNLNPTASTGLSIITQYAYEDRANWINWYNLNNATKPPPGTDLNDRIRSHKFMLGGEYKQIVSNATFLLFRTSIFRTSYENNVGIDSPNYVASTASQLNSELQITSQINDKILITGGLNMLRNDVTSPYLTGSRGQYILSGYAQTEFSNLQDVIVTVGARLDNEQTFGQDANFEFSPKLGVSYKAPTETQLRFSIGRAFRAASITERFAALRFAGFTVGRNLGLQPEKGWSFEVGAQQTFEIFGAPWSIDAALFQSELFDLIEPQFVTTSQRAEIQFRNITRARVQGVETMLRGWIGKNRLFGFETGLTALVPRDLTLGQTLRYRNTTQWTTRLLIPLSPLDIQFEYRYLSRIENIDNTIVSFVGDGDARVPIHVLDMRIIWDFQKSTAIPVTVSLNIKNLLDYYYVEYIGNLAPTRQITLQFDAKM